MSKTNRAIEKQFRRWFNQLDSKYFSGYFSDKKIKILFPKKDMFWDVDNLAWASVADMEIAINPETLKVATIAELKDTLLHEMLHFWIFACHPRGRTNFGDKCKAFRDWSRFTNCPVAGRVPGDSEERKFWSCGDCGRFTVGGHAPQRCPTCNSDFIKSYSSRRCGRHL